MSLDAPSSKDAEQLVMPEEAARIMSLRAGYKITTDDLRQLRRRGKVKPAKQLSRTTLYQRLEIERAPLPKKRVKRIKPSADAVNPDTKSTRRTQVANIDIDLALQMEVQRVELEKQRLALEERRLALEERRLEVERTKLGSEKVLKNHKEYAVTV